MNEHNQPVIYQMAPHFSYGDAIGNNIMEIDRLLKKWGYETEIFAGVIHPKLTATPYTDYARKAKEGSWLIYHYSTGSEVNDYILEQGRNIILIYHNVTPAEFFEPYDAEATENCRAGRALLPAFAEKVVRGVGVSRYNADELASLGFVDPAVSPLIVGSTTHQATGESPFADDLTNILYVGRLAPNKGIDSLLKAFYFYKLYVNSKSRLVLLGRYDATSPYHLQLKRMIETMDLPDVVFTGHVDDERMGDYYQAASVYLSLSEHEGFCVPLLEAMREAVPVVALNRGAVGETLGSSGILLEDNDPAAIAEAIGLLVEDEALRTKIIDGQIRRLDYFAPEKSEAIFRMLLEKELTNGVTAG